MVLIHHGGMGWIITPYEPREEQPAQRQMKRTEKRQSDDKSQTRVDAQSAIECDGFLALRLHGIKYFSAVHT